MKLEDYVKMANQLKDVSELMHTYVHTHKTYALEKRWWRANKALTRLVSDLEDMMFLECHDELLNFCKCLRASSIEHSHIEATDIFYGSEVRVDLVNAKLVNVKKV